MRLPASLCAGLLAALLLAQAGESAPKRRVRAPADGGPVLLGTDPPGTLKPWPDAGPQAGADAGPTATERQIAELKARVDGLERQLQQQQQQSQQLQQVTSEMQQLRQQHAGAEQQRQAEQQQAAAQRSQ